MIFLCSIFASFLLLVLERSIGIDWDFHVDAVTYVDSMEYYKLSNIGSLFDVSNNLHYYVVSMFGVNGTIAYNMVLTALGNQIIYSLLLKNITGNLQFYLILYLINPYKMHLSVTLLKDSAIIFFLVLTLFTKLNFLGILLGGAYRNAFIFYVILHSKFRRFYFLIFAVVVALYFYTIDFTMETFKEHLGHDMIFRDFDLVPNFTEYGPLAGSILRIFVWPVITITGLFFVISPTIAYFPLFLGSVSFVLVFKKLKMTKAELFPVIFILAFFAMIVPGFTSYYRYVFPLITLLPYIIIINRYGSQ